MSGTARSVASSILAAVILVQGISWSQTPLGTPQEVVMAEGYYKPLDGRYAFGTVFPLVNTYAGANHPGLLAGTPLAGAPEQHTIIEAVVNGAPASAFTEEDVGKEFVLLWGHRNPAHVDRTRVDEFAPMETTSRYSRVVHRLSPSRIVVDFPYNGGNAEKPADLRNAKARIFKDSSADWKAFGATLNRPETPDVGRLEAYRPHPAGSFRVHAYELKSFDPMTITLGRQVKIHAGAPDQYALVKVGVEDHYLLEVDDGTPIYKRPEAIFNVSNGGANFICQNIVFSPAHRQHKGRVVHGIRVLTSATGKPAGTIAIIGCKTYTEFDQIADTARGAAGITHELPALSSVTNGRAGSYSGQGLARRASVFVTMAFINCDFMGANPFGASTASGDGCNMVYIDCTGDFNPQSRWGTNVLDYTGHVRADEAAYRYAPAWAQEARKAGWYPTDVVVPKGDANMLVGLQLGGSNRFNVTNIERFIFLKNTPGNSNLTGYYNVSYNRSGTKIPVRAEFKSVSYDILQHEIPRANKRYVISRHYTTSTRTYDWREANGNKGLSTADLFSYLTNYNNPMSAVVVADPTGFRSGDTVTSEGTAKRVVEVVGNELRLMDRTGDFAAGKVISNGRVATPIVRYHALRCEYAYPKALLPFAIRMDACWTTILQCFGHEVDPMQIPSKGRGVAVQAGDQFRILPCLLVTLPGRFADVDAVRGRIVGSRRRATAEISSFLRTYDPTRSQEKNIEEPYYQVNLADVKGTFEPGETILLTDGKAPQTATVRKVSTHDPVEVHTAKGIERVAYPDCPAEFVWARYRTDTRLGTTDTQRYYTFYNVCEKALPADLPVTLEIEIVKSNAERLLNPAATAQVRQKYISNGTLAGRQVFEWPARGSLWQEGNGWGSANMNDSGDMAGHFAYSQVHHYWYFLRCDMNHGFWRQNYLKPPTRTITFKGEAVSVVPLEFYSRGHILINCRRPMTGQFSRGDEGSQNFDRRRIVEDYLAGLGEIPPVAEKDRAKLMSFGGDAKANTGYRHSYVREEDTANAPLPPSDLVEVLKTVGVEVLPLDRPSPNSRVQPKP